MYYKHLNTVEHSTHPFAQCPIKLRDPNVSRKSDPLPVPKGDSPYALAKRAEYIEKNLEKAKDLYKKAISQGDRRESAVKDLASVLHQEGRTQEACQILSQYSHLFPDQNKLRNLLANLKKQVSPTGNCLNKNLRIWPLSHKDTSSTVKKLFKNGSRILDVEIKQDIADPSRGKFAIVRFSSHSAARKTLEGFHKWDKYRVEWVTANGEVIGEANHSRHKREIPKLGKEGLSIWSLPVDELQPQFARFPYADEETAKFLLGKDLFNALEDSFTV